MEYESYGDTSIRLLTTIFHLTSVPTVSRQAHRSLVPTPDYRGERGFLLPVCLIDISYRVFYRGNLGTRNAGGQGD